ncbi:uncharacterized protein LOC134439238 [Engraulis encrasicolus]|uniref:uncharacterized protein LOC134439238 n=1 Tax=Engraulis encrasicolus TaxID=184585 RepID=UPI002FD5C81D
MESCFHPAMELIENVLSFSYFTTIFHGLFIAVVIPVVFLWKGSVHGLQKKWHGSSLYGILHQGARITELNLQNKKLQDELQAFRRSQLAAEQENLILRATIYSLQRHNNGNEERIKLLNKKLSQNQQADMVIIQIEPESHPLESRDGRAQDITVLQHKISELEQKEMSSKARIASMETAAHNRLITSSALHRQLVHKTDEVFFLHHRLMESMKRVAAMRGTRFVPPPLHRQNQKSKYGRVRDSWNKILTRTRLHVIPEERGDVTQKINPRMAAPHQATRMAASNRANRMAASNRANRMAASNRVDRMAAFNRASNATAAPNRAPNARVAPNRATFHRY